MRDTVDARIARFFKFIVDAFCRNFYPDRREARSGCKEEKRFLSPLYCIEIRDIVIHSCPRCEYRM